MFVAHEFSFELDLGTLISPPVVVPRLSVDGLEITVPPKGQRPSFVATAPAAPAKASQLTEREITGTVISTSSTAV
jgi:hypothetical protein